MEIIAFAPIQGQTDYIYRNVHNELFGGVDTYYSPFIRMLTDKTIRNKDKKDVEPSLNNIGSFVPQVLGSNSEDMQILFDYLVSLGYRRIDVNMGCSYSMIAKRGQGAGLLKKEERAKVEELMKLISRNPQLEVSLKMRLGWSSPDESLSLMPLINDTPLHSVTLHARLGIQQYEGECDLASFGAFYEGCNHKLLYNGDINSVEAYQKIATQYPRLYGVMIGRGLLGDPSLAIDIKQVNDSYGATEERKAHKLHQFHDALLAAYSQKLQGDMQIIRKMQTIWEYFMPGTNKKLLKKIKKASKMTAYNEAVNLIFAGNN